MQNTVNAGLIRLLRLYSKERLKTKPSNSHGAEVLGVDFPWPIKDIILQHHERVDGSGYPKGLKNSNRSKNSSSS